MDHPVNQYVATKTVCELLAYTYHHLYGLHSFKVYGDRGRLNIAPFKFIDRIGRGVDIHQFGNGSSSRDYACIYDIVDGVVRSIDSRLYV